LCCGYRQNGRKKAEKVVGRILFIRVSAETYDEKEVIRAWPKLYAMLWPDADSTGSPGKMVRDLLPESRRGVLQLADAFVERVHFGDVPAGAREALIDAAKIVKRLREDLDAAQGDRDVRVAAGLATAIEDTLDGAEQAMRDG